MNLQNFFIIPVNTENYSITLLDSSIRIVYFVWPVVANLTIAIGIWMPLTEQMQIGESV